MPEFNPSSDVVPHFVVVSQKTVKCSFNVIPMNKQHQQQQEHEQKEE